MGNPFEGGEFACTAEEASLIKRYLVALKCGLYGKCHGCHKVKFNESFEIRYESGIPMVYCEECQ